MSKYKDIILQVAECDDGAILWNTGDGVAILIEEDSIYSEIHKYLKRIIELTDEQSQNMSGDYELKVKEPNYKSIKFKCKKTNNTSNQ